ncbi:tetratricopeptide repeat protein [Ascidiimonas sp. W6]|uniref:tetratricopeptide repeat protein n=1 Tax=Ascidiimonas meishanensis TaxID=3128903 RepID=UPI0030EF5079
MNGIYKIIFFYFLLSSQLLISQNQTKVDSLKNELTKASHDSTKLKLFEKLYSAELYRNPQDAKKYVTNAMHLAKKLARNKSYNQAVYGIATYYYLVKDLDSSRHYYTKSLNLARKYTHKELVAKSISSLALMEKDLNKALKMRDSANSILLEIKNYLNYAIGISERAKLINQKGDHTKAYEEAYKALRILDTINAEPYRAADINVQLGEIEEKRGNRKEAIKFYLDALEIFIKTNDFVYQSNVYNRLGFTYFNLKEYPDAIKSLEKGLELAEKYRLKSNYSESLGYLGITYLHLNEFDRARDYLEKGIAFDKRFKRDDPSSFKLLHLGRVEAAVKNFDKSYNYFNEALALAKNNKNKIIERDTYRSFANTYELSNNLNESIKYTKLYVNLKDSLLRAYNNKEIENLKIAYQTEKKEAALALQEEEIKTLNANAENDKLIKILYGGGTIAGIVLSGLLFFGFSQRMKKNKIEREKQEEIYKQEITFKQKELASQTLHLVQKNTFLQELKENLENLKNSPEKFKVEFRRIVMLLKKESATDKDWEVFKSYFTEVHDNFDNKLKAINASISEKDLRLASFIRMNLSTKEIAAILNVLPQSVLTSKYRLKKKLNIEKENDLYGFLSNL